MKKKVIKVVLGVLLGLLVLAGLFTLFNFHLVTILWGNWFGPKTVLSESDEWDGGQSYTHVAYADTSDAEYLDLYVPDSDQPMPLLILIHGGGFYFNDSQSRQASLMYRYFRDHGYACASINYRLSKEAGYPAAIEDCKAAIRFLRANADQYGYDPDCFITWGESAGGYLSTITAFSNDREFSSVKFIGEDQMEEEVSSEVQIMTEFYGVEEFGTMSGDWDNLGIPKLIRYFSNLWLSEPLKEEGGKYDSVEELFLRSRISDLSEEELEKAGARYYLSENYSKENPIPVMIWHGDADITVPYLESERFAAYCSGLLGEENVDYTLFHGYGHASDGFYLDSTLEQMKNYLDDTIKKLS